MVLRPAPGKDLYGGVPNPWWNLQSRALPGARRRRGRAEDLNFAH